MGTPHKSPYAVLELDQGAPLSAIEAAYARGLRLLEEGSMASYGMFDAASTQRLRDELDAAYRALKRAVGQQPPSVPPPAAPALEEPQPEPVTVGATPAHLRPPPTAAAPAAPKARPKRAPVAAKPAEHASAPQAEAELEAPAPPPSLAAPSRVRLCAPRTEPLEEPLTGAVLRQLRQQLGAAIDDICDLTKINRRYIVALEEEDFSLLPATVYVRGFVGEYARVLGLDAQATAPYLEAYTKWSRARL